MLLSAVLDLASRFRKSLSELVTLTFSEKKSRKPLISLVSLFYASNILLFSRQQEQERVSYCCQMLSSQLCPVNLLEGAKESNTQ